MEWVVHNFGHLVVSNLVGKAYIKVLVLVAVVVSEMFIFAVNTEMKRVADCREDLHKSRMKFLDERCRRAQERVRRLANIKTLEKEIEEQRVRDQQKLQQLCSHSETLQRLLL